MNKKLFMSATALTAITVAGLVYYRHEILAKVDRLLHTRVQEPEGDLEKAFSQWKDSEEETETAYVDGRPVQVPKSFVEELEHSLHHPEARMTRERPQRKPEGSNE